MMQDMPVAVRFPATNLPRGKRRWEGNARKQRAGQEVSYFSKQDFSLFFFLLPDVCVHFFQLESSSP